MSETVLGSGYSRLNHTDPHTLNLKKSLPLWVIRGGERHRHMACLMSTNKMERNRGGMEHRNVGNGHVFMQILTRYQLCHKLKQKRDGII